jgi:VRR-NUC domain
MTPTYKDLRVTARQAWQEDEQKLQTECSKWLKKDLFNRGEPQLYYHVPNERKASMAQLSRLKAQGVLSGVSDVVLPLRSSGFSGVYCELKKAKGSPSPEQKQFLTGVANEGYLAIIVNDIETFKRVFTAYLDERKNNTLQ